METVLVSCKEAADDGRWKYDAAGVLVRAVGLLAGQLLSVR